MDAQVPILCVDRIQVSGLWDASRNPSPASFPFFCGMGHESVHDCHDAADSRVSGMAEARSECCCGRLGHGRDTSVLATSQHCRVVTDYEKAENVESCMSS